MHPDLIQFNLWGLNLDIKAYSFFLSLAVLIVISGSIIYTAKRGLPIKKSIILIISMALAMLIGSRLLHYATSYSAYSNWQEILAFNWHNFSLFGGLILAALTGLLLNNFLKLNLWQIGDTIAPFLGLGIVCARIGCYLNGCCFGQITNFPWGVTYPLMSDAHLWQLSQGKSSLFSVLPVHPTQIYELIAALFASLLAFYLIKKKSAPGLAFTLSAIWFIIFRFFNHFLRINPPSYQSPDYFYPILYLFLLFLCLFSLYKINRSARQFKEKLDNHLT